mmetsp:Transcript_30345/g.72974  ORF Transcript_30345/g.72974 Transcript_30345/m.72974 type:complete len:335 (+) Transcript_30345:2314-3318(+)
MPSIVIGPRSHSEPPRRTANGPIKVRVGSRGKGQPVPAAVNIGAACCWVCLLFVPCDGIFGGDRVGRLAPNPIAAAIGKEAEAVASVLKKRRAVQQLEQTEVFTLRSIRIQPQSLLEAREEEVLLRPASVPEDSGPPSFHPVGFAFRGARNRKGTSRARRALGVCDLGGVRVRVLGALGAREGVKNDILARLAEPREDIGPELDLFRCESADARNQAIVIILRPTAFCSDGKPPPETVGTVEPGQAAAGALLEPAPVAPIDSVVGSLNVFQALHFRGQHVGGHKVGGLLPHHLASAVGVLEVELVIHVPEVLKVCQPRVVRVLLLAEEEDIIMR